MKSKIIFKIIFEKLFSMKYNLKHISLLCKDLVNMISSRLYIGTWYLKVPGTLALLRHLEQILDSYIWLFWLNRGRTKVRVRAQKLDGATCGRLGVALGCSKMVLATGGHLLPRNPSHQPSWPRPGQPDHSKAQKLYTSFHI